MARDTQKAAKTETLTIRLDPKTRFVLEYLSRIKGQTITTVVERAIVSAGAQETLKDREFGHDLTWSDFWDVSEGVRAMNIARRSEFFPTFEEERRLEFAKNHWPFFFATRRGTIPLNHYIDILWPRIDDYVQLHEDNKAKGGDWFGAGKAMQEALKAANLRVPEWPAKEPALEKTEKPTPPPSKTFMDDDDIPF